MIAPLLEVENLSKTYGTRRGWFSRQRLGGFAAVADLGFSVARGETFGIVGESGSGKSTTARMLLRLVEPTAGSIRLGGRDLRALDAEALRRERRGIQMVFQDPFASLNPRLSVGDQIGEPIRIHGLATGAAVSSGVADLLARVGLDPARAGSYPHEFSGGQRQRIAIARALASQPQLIIADEAVSALDVSVRAQILNLFDDLKQSADLTLIFISHDLGVVRHLVDRIAVMYRGRIVEIGPAATIFAIPRHPYTHALLAAMPLPRVGARRERAAARIITSAAETTTGCSYRARCPLAADICRTAPPLAELAPGHASACFRAAEVAPVAQPQGDIPSAADARLKRLQARFLEHAGEAVS